MKFSKTKHGPMIYPDNDQYTGRSLDVCGEAQSAEIDFLLDLVGSDSEDVFVDIGAGIGNVVIPMAKKIGSSGYVLAIEASSFLYYALCGNIALNHLNNVQAYHRAVTDNSTGHCYYPDLDPEGQIDFRDIALTTLLNSDDHLGRKCEHPVATLCMDDLRLANPALIKVDISGMEMKALAGLRATIERSAPYLFLRSKEPNKEMIDFVTELGYEWEVHSPPVFNPHNFLGSKDVFDDEKRSYVFCYHKDKKIDSEFACLMPDSDQRLKFFEKLRSN